MRRTSADRARKWGQWGKNTETKAQGGGYWGGSRGPDMCDSRREGAGRREKQGMGQILEGLSGVGKLLCSLCGAMTSFLNFPGETIQDTAHLLIGKRHGSFTQGYEDGEEGKRCSEDGMTANNWEQSWVTDEASCTGFYVVAMPVGEDKCGKW